MLRFGCKTFILYTINYDFSYDDRHPKICERGCTYPLLRITCFVHAWFDVAGKQLYLANINRHLVITLMNACHGVLTGTLLFDYSRNDINSANNGRSQL